MRLLLCSLLLTLPLAAEKATFDDGRFSVTFPKGWKDAEPPQRNLLIHRENEEGTASFSISGLTIAKGARADLESTLQSFVKNFKANGMTVKGDPKGQESVIDGKTALVATVPVELKVQGELTPITSSSPPSFGAKVTLHLVLSASTPETACPSLKLSPCLVSSFWNWRLTSASMPGVMWSRYSITVTSVPSRL